MGRQWVWINERSVWDVFEWEREAERERGEKERGKRDKERWTTNQMLSISEGSDWGWSDSVDSPCSLAYVTDERRKVLFTDRSQQWYERLRGWIRCRCEVMFTQFYYTASVSKLISVLAKAIGSVRDNRKNFELPCLTHRQIVIISVPTLLSLTRYNE